jgi:serine/threonine protein kinase/Tol biopolymer transport system component
MIGQTISHYRITAKLGEGGMGEVYLAVDSQLDRKVALKFLPRQMSSQPDAKARFLQEARAASALNHPNICTIYDLQEADGQLFIVMEYVEGQTLRDRTQPSTLKQVVEIGIQVADGLAAAHEKGIVHRDIKTENLMIRKDGIVQIMDFGLAKLRGASRLTKEGSTIGTVGYMSPEQVQGLETDHRTDLFSLGVVLYELIAGQLPFKGVHETAIMYEIVNVDPQPLSAVRDDIDPELDRLILDCLQKDPNERCQSAREISRDLRRFKIDSGRKRQSRVSTVRTALSVSQAPAASAAATASKGGIGRFKGYAIVAAVAAVVTASAFLLFWRGSTDSASIHTFRFTVSAPPGTSLSGPGGGKIALSPDGQRLVFVAADSTGTGYLWLRPLNALTAERLPATDGGFYPFWAPDSRQVGFFANGKLKKVDVTGGSVLTLCDAPAGRGGTWNRDGVIVFAPHWLGGLSRISASGGIPVAITHTDSLQNQWTHRWPHFLPDGNRFLYLVRMGSLTTDSSSRLWVGSLDGSVNRALMRSVSNAGYAHGHIIFLRERTLMAQRFDAGKAEPRGDPVPVAEGVFFNPDYGNADFSVAENGTLAYQAGEGGAGYYLIWFDRSGLKTDTIGEPGRYRNCMLSPDGRFLAVDLTADVPASNSDVWVYDLTRDVKTRLTFAPGVDDYPVWSPDGSYIYFSSGRGASKRDLYCKPSSGAGEEQLLLTSDQDKFPTGCAPDGRHLVFLAPQTKGAAADDLWVLPLAEGGAKAAFDPIPFQQTAFSEDDARFSPDGRWLAYYSDETGRGEVYVRPFPGPGGKWQISTESGDYPCWRRDGKQLFYITEKNMLMAVDVNGTGSSFEAGRPRPLFQMMNPIPASTISPYDVTADGQRFIIITGDAGQTSTINVAVNWDAELQTK